MKQKTEAKATTAVVATTKVKLTIQGQSFDMTMEELKALHEKIGKVVEPVKPTVIFAPRESPRDRSWPPMVPQWSQPSPRPDPEPLKVTC